MHRNWSRHEKRLTSRCPSYLATSRRNVCSGRCCTSWVKTKRPCDMTASRSGLGPASGGDALESVTGKDRSNNDVKQPLTRLVVNFYRTVVAQAKKGGSRRHGAKALDLDQAVAGREKSKSSSLRSHPHPPSGHLLPQAGEGLKAARREWPAGRCWPQHRRRRGWPTSRRRHAAALPAQRNTGPGHYCGSRRRVAAASRSVRTRDRRRSPVRPGREIGRAHV